MIQEKFQLKNFRKYRQKVIYKNYYKTNDMKGNKEYIV